MIISNKSIYILTILFVIIGVGCKKEFLNKTPLNQISEPEFWKTSSDLEVYLNNFYASLPDWGSHDGGPYWWDNNSDNMAPGLFNTRLAGLITLPATGGGWNWGNIRSTNLFLEKAPTVEQSDLKDHYLGEGHFFRAWFYFSLLQTFGDLPWIDRPLQTNSEELYKPRDPRNIVADNILKDLDEAIALLRDKETAPLFRINRSIALTFKSRVALYEGSWQKYHAGTAFAPASTTPDKYYREAANAAGILIEEAKYSIFNENNPTSDYASLFNQSDLSNNPEVIFWRKYKLGLTSHNGQRYLSIIAGNTGVTRSLVESFLCKDGKPISVSPLYQGDNGLTNIMANRDLRLKQLVFSPGDPITIDYESGGDTLSIFQRSAIHLGGESRDVTGYQIKKGSYPDKTLQQGDFLSVTAPIIFRFAEVLLNYAEAKAELGELTQSDIDKSINLLRDRVAMPRLTISAIETDPNWDFPTLSPLLNEIRRERRVELACEGFRLSDLMRWRAHNLFGGKRSKGVKLIPSEYPEGISISVDAQGYIDPYQSALPAGFGFNPDRDYLMPLPAYELSLNEGLSQNPGWPRK